jgi:hypothetical protein
VRCSSSSTPPPFQFAATAVATPERSGLQRAALAPVRAVALVLAASGRIVDAAFFLVMLTIWNALHLVVWSYAFKTGPAANCFTLPCPTWLETKVLIAGAVLAVTSYVLARFFRKLGHRATSFMLLVLVTFDVAALMVLGVGSIT